MQLIHKCTRTISDRQQNQQSMKSPTSLLSARAIDRAMLVLPTPGGP